LHNQAKLSKAEAKLAYSARCHLARYGYRSWHN